MSLYTGTAMCAVVQVVFPSCSPFRCLQSLQPHVGEGEEVKDGGEKYSSNFSHYRWSVERSRRPERANAIRCDGGGGGVEEARGRRRRRGGTIGADGWGETEGEERLLQQIVQTSIRQWCEWAVHARAHARTRARTHTTRQVIAEQTEPELRGREATACLFRLCQSVRKHHSYTTRQLTGRHLCF